MASENERAQNELQVDIDVAFAEDGSHTGGASGTPTERFDAAAVHLKAAWQSDLDAVDPIASTPPPPRHDRAEDTLRPPATVSPPGETARFKIAARRQRFPLLWVLGPGGLVAVVAIVAALASSSSQPEGPDTLEPETSEPAPRVEAQVSQAPTPTQRAAEPATPLGGPVRLIVMIDPPTAHLTLDGVRLRTPFDGIVASRPLATLRAEATGFKPRVEAIALSQPIEISWTLDAVAGAPSAPPQIAARPDPPEQRTRPSTRRKSDAKSKRATSPKAAKSPGFVSSNPYR